jgi:hypothetical protein
MPSDIVERARRRAELAMSGPVQHAIQLKALLRELADEIERLRKLPDLLADEIIRLREEDVPSIVAKKINKARNDALEEAAKFCAEGNELAHGNYFAAGIRALKGGE